MQRARGRSTRPRCARPRRRARSTATRSSRRSSPTRRRRSSRRRRWPTRGACASTASTFPDPTFDENGGAQVRIGRGSGIEPGVREVPGGPEGLPRARCPARARRTRRTSDEAPGAWPAAARRPRRSWRRRARRRRRRGAARARSRTPRGRRRPSSGATSSTARPRRDARLRRRRARSAPASSGVLTGAARARAATITRGHSLYDVDGEPAAFLLYGALPAWRDFAPGMTDGEDIRQLERNLRALGYDPGTSTTTGTARRPRPSRASSATASSTTTARSPAARSSFRPGPTRIGRGEGRASATRSRPGRPLAEISSTERRVTVELDARRQQIAREGDSVTVELPNGRTVERPDHRRRHGRDQAARSRRRRSR